MLEGSRARSSRVGVQPAYQALREKLIQEAVLVPDHDGRTLRFARDQLFSSPSAAAAVVVGGPPTDATTGRCKAPESPTATGKPAASSPPPRKHHPKQAAPTTQRPSAQGRVCVAPALLVVRRLSGLRQMSSTSRGIEVVSCGEVRLADQESCRWHAGQRVWPCPCAAPLRA